LRFVNARDEGPSLRVIGDTIAAIAPPAGEGALSIVRVSGPSAVAIADECFSSRKRPSQMPSHTVRYGRVVDRRGRTLDRVLLTVMRGPRTSTGEDTVEISCHGGRLVSCTVLERVLAAGARLAEPGEFTRRAFLNGHMDLVQAEGVLEVIRARTDAGLRAALRQVEGQVSNEYEALREKLDECRVQMECAIEFAEETTPWPDERILRHLQAAAAELESMWDRARAGRRIQDGARVAIIGRPNVGKSTLFNQLLGEERVIVTDEPGTTRDVVAEWTAIDGIPVRLLDTAGIRSSDCPVERIAVERAREQGIRAEIVLLLMDASRNPDEEDERTLAECRPERTFVVLNKIDLGVAEQMETWAEEKAGGGVVERVSALNRSGIEGLRTRIAQRIARDHLPDAGLVASLRQIDILRRALEGLRRSASAMSNGAGIELAASDLRESLDIFGELAGTTQPEEILNRIFSEFCIGK